MRVFVAFMLLLGMPVNASSDGSSAEGSVWDGVYSQAQAKQGAKLFVEHCVACHSTKPGEMSGHGPAPSVIGEDFAFRWLDSSVADLYDAIRQTMPEGAPNSLSPAQYAALTAYIFELNGYPAGESALDAANYDALANIWIEEKAD